MALCEHCRAALEGTAERLPPPWFDHDKHLIAGRRATKMQWALLEVLYRRRGRIVSKDSLITLMYSDRLDVPFDKIIDVYICKLRPLLAASPYRIRTHWGEGYQLMDGDPQDEVIYEPIAISRCCEAKSPTATNTRYPGSAWGRAAGSNTVASWRYRPPAPKQSNAGLGALPPTSITPATCGFGASNKSSTPRFD